MRIAMEGCGPQPRVYSSAEYETLAAELVEIKNSMVYRTSLIGRLEAELDTIKAGAGEPVAYADLQEFEICVHRPAGKHWVPIYTTPQPAQDVDGLVRVLKSLSSWIETLPVPTSGATSKLMLIDEALAKFAQGVENER